MDRSSTIFGYYIGAFGLLTSVLSSAYFCHNYFPSAQLKVLDDLLRETQEYYEKARVDGLLSTQYAELVQTELLIFNSVATDLRDCVYQCRNPVDEVLAFLRGLSRRISKVAGNVKILRSDIASASEQMRARIRRESEATGVDHDLVPVDQLGSSPSPVENALPPVPDTQVLNPVNLPSGCTTCSATVSQASMQPPDFELETASTSTTVVSIPFRWSKLLLWPFSPYLWKREETKEGTGDLELGHVQDSPVVPADPA